MADDKEKTVERRSGQKDRRNSTDRRGGERVVETEEPRRKNPDRRDPSD